MTASRRDFVQGLAAAAAALNVPAAFPQANSASKLHTVPSSYFDLNAVYTDEELALLYRNNRIHPKSHFFDAQLAPAATTRDSVLFYWDDAKKKLTNPYNVTPDSSIASGKQYTINADVLNFHPSSADVDSVWSKLDTNLQLTFRTYAVDSQGDLLTSITMAGLDFAQDYLSGKDGKLLTVPSDGGKNNLTNFSASEQITITNGEVNLMIGLAGQKKKSFWDTLVSIFGQVTNSPVFGMLPIPKLYQTAASTISTLLSQVEQSQRLVQVLNGKKLYFRIYNGGSTNPFVLRPGYWVVLDAQAAGPHIDQNTHDINDWVLDLPDQLYEVKDHNGDAVDITYSVANIQLPEAKKVSS
jgi:hypothetical protein